MECYNCQESKTCPHDSRDGIAHDRMISGAHFKTSYDPNKGHSVSDFLGYISQLPEGHYEVINGKIVKR